MAWGFMLGFCQCAVQRLFARFCYRVLALLMLVVTPLSYGKSCNIELRYGILITPEHIRIIHGNTTKVQINNDKQLFINGQWLRLEAHEQILLRKFSTGLRKEVPQIVGIAMEGAEIGLAALDRIMKGIDDSGDGNVFEQEIDDFRSRFKQKFNHVDGKYYIAPQSLAKLDDFFEDELGKEIKTVVTSSVGAVLVALGDAFSSSDTVVERNVVDVGEQLERLEQKIERQLEAKSSVLEQKAEQFCRRLIELDRTESELHVMLPQLRRYNVVLLQK